jgi:hypothetical protein
MMYGQNKFDERPVQSVQAFENLTLWIVTGSLPPDQPVAFGAARAWPQPAMIGDLPRRVGKRLDACWPFKP